MSDGFKSASFDIVGQTPAHARTSSEIIAYWVERLTGKPPEKPLLMALMEYMPHPSNLDFVPDIHHPSFKEPLQQMVMLVGMLPEFQKRSYGH